MLAVCCISQQWWSSSGSKKRRRRRERKRRKKKRRRFFRGIEWRVNGCLLEASARRWQFVNKLSEGERGNDAPPWESDTRRHTAFTDVYTNRAHAPGYLKKKKEEENNNKKKSRVSKTSLWTAIGMISAVLGHLSCPVLLCRSVSRSDDYYI